MNLNNNAPVKILGVKIANVTLTSALAKICEYIDEDRLHVVYTPNSEIIMAATRDTQLVEILNFADLTVADGAGVVIASKILNTPLPERVAGFDLVSAMFNDIRFKKSSYFFLGTKREIIEKASENIREKYNLNIAGIQDGYFSLADEDKIIEQINSSGAQILLVALGAPKQERWIYNNREKLKVRLAIGVGGSFDVFSGISKRAPLFFQRNNLEWLYRLCKEPWRYKRMLDLPIFILHVMRELFKK